MVCTCGPFHRTKHQYVGDSDDTNLPVRSNSKFGVKYSGRQGAPQNYLDPEMSPSGIQGLYDAFSTPHRTSW